MVELLYYTILCVACLYICWSLTYFHGDNWHGMAWHGLIWSGLFGKERKWSLLIEWGVFGWEIEEKKINKGSRVMKYGHTTRSSKQARDVGKNCYKWASMDHCHRGLTGPHIITIT